MSPTPRGVATSSLLLGLVTGVIKHGWVPFPPRTPERNLTNPPQELAQQLDFTHATVTFNGNEVEYISLFMHFGFSIFFGGLVYCVVAEKYPQIKLWQGVAHGPFIWFAWHVVLMRRWHDPGALGSALGGVVSRRSPATQPGCG